MSRVKRRVLPPERAFEEQDGVSIVHMSGRRVIVSDTLVTVPRPRVERQFQFRQLTLVGHMFVPRHFGDAPDAKYM